MRVLAVDDDESILEILKAALEISDRKSVEISPSAAQALHVIDRAAVPFDCFLLDIQMPEMDGIALCREIRTKPLYQNTPILMVTAMSEKNYIDQAFAVGATDFVTKPLNFPELEMRLDVACAHRAGSPHNSPDDAKATGPISRSDLGAMSLSEPFEPIGVKRAIGYVAFENYVLQLTRSYLFFSSVFAIKIADIDAVFQQSSHSEFRNIVTRCAQAISDSIHTEGSVISYRGDGIFLCIQHSNLNPRQSAIAPLAEERFRTASDQNSVALTSHSIRFVIGDPVSLGVLSRAATLNSMRKAVDKVTSAKPACTPIIQSSADPSHKEMAPAKNNAQLRIDYELILRESLQQDICDLLPRLNKCTPDNSPQSRQTLGKNR